MANAHATMRLPLDRAMAYAARKYTALCHMRRNEHERASSSQIN